MSIFPSRQSTQPGKPRKKKSFINEPKPRAEIPKLRSTTQQIITPTEKVGCDLTDSDLTEEEQNEWKKFVDYWKRKYSNEKDLRSAQQDKHKIELEEYAVQLEEQTCKIERLKEKMSIIQEDHEQKANAWEKEKMKIISEIERLKTELRKIQKSSELKLKEAKKEYNSTLKQYGIKTKIF